ncbi:MAG: RNA methyltransferase [Spirochaetaceae bacterium]|jgi:tRNA/rRNA methyltransferase/tRNA (cytidine32/uridine32-2'-O)-methyltransferase|nr:RNA methyltransferase [Spirochaetaceae bacterium]
MKLDDIVVVLCRPSEAGNVGAVCRAMMNGGLTSLRLVAPSPMDEAVVRARAVHAENIWEHARRFDDLAQAIDDCSLIIGTTRRRGRRRKTVTLDPAQVAEFVKNYPGDGTKAALVFGNERTGLEQSELALCGLSSHIPAHGSFPSLNLSHSVQIYAYELYRTLHGAQEPPQGSWQPLSVAETSRLAASICNELAGLGFYTLTGRAAHEEFFRDVFTRAGISQAEGVCFHQLIVKAIHLAQRCTEENALC